MGDEFPEVPFTPVVPDLHAFIFTAAEMRVLRASLGTCVRLAQFLGGQLEPKEMEIITELRDRFEVDA